MRRATLALALLAALIALVALAGCGVSTQEGSTSSTAGQSIEEKEEKLPPRPAGTIRIAGATDVAPTEELLEQYGSRAPEIEIADEKTEESEAFARFCTGKADIVASVRPISRQEYESCRRRSVKPVQIQLASDAAVLAIRNETNVGVDCLTLGEAKEIFRAGSPITNWSQVSFLDTANAGGLAPPVKVTGPDAESSLFEFFSSIVLETTVPSLASVRGDYRAHAEPQGVRLQVIGGNNKRLRLAARSQAAKEVLHGQLQTLAGARTAVKEAEVQVKKGIRDRRSAAAKEADRRHLAEAKAKLARVEARLPTLHKRYGVYRSAARRLREARGTLGIFGFTYYEVWEEQLRPMEIDTRPADAAQPNCIFPSTQTVSDATYPLARQTLMTVSLQRLHEAEIQELLAFMVRNAASSAEQLGLVALPDERRDQELAWISGQTPPEVIFYPVSSGSAKAESGPPSESEGEGG